MTDTCRKLGCTSPRSTQHGPEFPLCDEHWVAIVGKADAHADAVTTAVVSEAFRAIREPSPKGGDEDKAPWWLRNKFLAGCAGTYFGIRVSTLQARNPSKAAALEERLLQIARRIEGGNDDGVTR